jgi:hypothetical protein
MAFSLVMSPSTWPMRFIRWIGCDRNPLRRTSDRIETRVVLLAAVSYVPVAVLAAGYASHRVYEAGVRAQHAIHLRHVAAVALTAAESIRPATVGVPVRWTIDGWTQTGALHRSYGTPRGAVVRVWVDQSGHITTPPLTTVQLEDQVLTIKVLMPLLLAQAFALSLYTFRWYLDKRRFAKWDSEWRLIDPGG